MRWAAAGLSKAFDGSPGRLMELRSRFRNPKMSRGERVRGRFRHSASGADPSNRPRLDSEPLQEQTRVWLLRNEIVVAVVVACLITLTLGAFIGATQGILATLFEFSPIIVTLGYFTAVRALAFVVSGGLENSSFGSSFDQIGQSVIQPFSIPTPLTRFRLRSARDSSSRSSARSSSAVSRLAAAAGR